MILLPGEKEEREATAIQEFEKSGQLGIYEPCDCGAQIRHNNGGNYHEEIYLQRDGDKVYIKRDSTCELEARAEWEECSDWQEVVQEFADWL